MEIREARAEELPLIRGMIEERGHERIDLEAARVWVAVENGEIVGFLPCRMVWQLEPLVVLSENRMTSSRAALLLYRAAEQWIADRTRNRTGIHWFFAVTRSKAVKGWASRLGWFRQYRGAAIFLKYL